MAQNFSSQPRWLIGKEGALKKLYKRASKDSKIKYQPYEDDKGRAIRRIEKFTPLQKESFKLGKKEVNNPKYQEIFNDSVGLVKNASQRSVTPQLQPYLDRSTQDPTQNINQYMNPYNRQVTEEIGRLGSRNLLENILPNVRDKFINAGQYGSSGHQDLTNRAIRDTQEGVSRAQGEALQSGFNNALQTSVGQQERNLQAGSLFGQNEGRDIERQLVGGEALQQIGNKQQDQRLQSTGFLNQLGGQQQNQGQQGRNIEYQNFQNQANHPFFQTARLNEITRGLPVNTQQFSSNYTPTPPQPSAYTQGAGLLAGGIGAYLNRPPQYAHGGHVEEEGAMEVAVPPPMDFTIPEPIHHELPRVGHLRHYAEGGAVPKNPIQLGVNDAMDTSEIQEMRNHARKLQQPQGDPFWGAVSRAGFALAASKNPNTLGAVGEAGQAGLDEYNAQNVQQGNREHGAAKILSLIDKTKRWQQEKDRTHELSLNKFEHQKAHDSQVAGIHAGQLGLQKEMFEHEKQYLKGPNGMIFKVGKGEKGEETLTPLEGQGNAMGTDLEYTKAKSKHEAKSDVEKGDEISKKGNEAYKEIKSIDDMISTLPSAKPGVGFKLRKGMVNTLDSWGVDTKGLELGDAPSMNRLQKGLTNLALKTAKSLSTKPTNFDLETIIEGLPQGEYSPKTVSTLLKVLRVEKEYDYEKKKAKDGWEKTEGSLRARDAYGKTFDEAYDDYADRWIWPQLKAINAK